jgi:hypothetical protein
MAVAAALVSREPLAAAAGVASGGVLAAISYRGIKAGVDVLTGSAAGDGRPEGVVFGLVKFFTRYAILAAVAWVIMARVRLPPVAIIAGASSLVVAIAFEALRPIRRNTPQ